MPHPVTRDDEVRRCRSRKTIALALANNSGIAAQRLEPFRTEQDILRSQGQFDPTLQGEIQSRTSTTPNASTLSGTTVNNVDDRFANFHLFKTFRTGTFVQVGNSLPTTTRATFLRPQYTPSLNLSVIQPLLRGFGWDFTYLVVRLEQTADAALRQYEANLADFITTVIRRTGRSFVPAPTSTCSVSRRRSPIGRSSRASA